MKVIFSHGKESGPWGNKIKRLAHIAQGMQTEVVSLDYTATFDPDARVALLSDYLESVDDNIILVGSSMGGYVSLVNAMTSPPVGLFLLAPALYMPGYAMQDYRCPCYTEVVHGWSDSVIPVENSIQFCKAANATLHIVPGDHSLRSELNTLIPLFRHFMETCISA